MSDPREIVDAALAASTADGCVVIVDEHTEANLRWANNAVTTNGQQSGRSVTVIATFERAGTSQSAGTVTRSVSTVDEVDELVRAAEVAGRSADPADDASPLIRPEDLPSDDDGSDGSGGDQPTWDDDPARTSFEVFGSLAAPLGAAFTRWRAQDRALYGFAEHQMSSCFLATSTGVRRRFDQPDGRFELNAKSADMSSTWFGMHTRDFADVDLDAALARSSERLDWANNRIDLPAGRYETILAPAAVADLMIYAYWSASSRDAEEGRSVFAAADGQTRLGTALCERALTLRSDPHEPGLQCAPFEIVTASAGGVASVFDNGAPVPAGNWITGGRLTELARDRAWARRTGAQPRPFVGNLLLHEPGARSSLAEMIANTRRGLLVNSLWYIREVDSQTLLLTGLTRDGVYLVEDGVVRGAVNNFRFNESPVGLLARVAEVGVTEHTLSREWSDDLRRTAMPPLRIPDFNMSTVSQAS